MLFEFSKNSFGCIPLGYPKASWCLSQHSKYCSLTQWYSNLFSFSYPSSNTPALKTGAAIHKWVLAWFLAGHGDTTWKPQGILDHFGPKSSLRLLGIAGTQPTSLPHHTPKCMADLDSGSWPRSCKLFWGMTQPTTANKVGLEVKSIRIAVLAQHIPFFHILSLPWSGFRFSSPSTHCYLLWEESFQ